MVLALRGLLHGAPGEHWDAMGELCPGGGQPAAQQDPPGKEANVLKTGCPKEGRMGSFVSPAARALGGDLDTSFPWTHLHGKTHRAGL